LTPATLQPLNRLRKLWRERRPTFGAIATIPSIQTVQIMARSGFDWIVVDLEHGPIDLGSAHAMITATSGTPCIPLARIAVNRIDEIMATPGIDMAVIGPGDLATSIDKRGRADDPEVLALMARAEAGILKSGVPIGGVARTPEQANQMIERGYVGLALGFDWSLFQRGIAASFDGIKR
jgi:4-hydroxy-2-oxoheptanedioate aldolase